MTASFAPQPEAWNESSTCLGWHRWLVERSFAPLARFRRLAVRDERRAKNLRPALPTLARAVICLHGIRRLCPLL